LAYINKYEFGRLVSGGRGMFKIYC